MPQLPTHLLAIVFLLCLGPKAHAEATSWLYVGAGVARVDSQSEGLSLQLDTGLGTPADRPLVVGGLARVAWHQAEGTALGALLRTTSRGLSRGDFGIGADIGIQQALGGERKSQFLANLVLGAPWGLTLVAGSTIAGTPRTLFASVGFDFARLTVHRRTGTQWFPNPKPAPEN